MAEKITEKVQREMEEKTPAQAVKDDLTGDGGAQRREDESATEKVQREMEEKTPMQAVKDDLTGKS